MTAQVQIIVIVFLWLEHILNLQSSVTVGSKELPLNTTSAEDVWNQNYSHFENVSFHFRLLHYESTQTTDLYCPFYPNL